MSQLDTGCISNAWLIRVGLSPAPRGWYATGGCPKGEQSVRWFLQSLSQSGWWVIWGRDNRLLHTIQYVRTLWFGPGPVLPSAKGLLRMVKCCHKLVFHAQLLFFFFYSSMRVCECFCGRCAITVSSLNPRISSKWGAGGKHWRLLNMLLFLHQHVKTVKCLKL